VQWYKAVGDKLEVDDTICEIDMKDLKLDLEADEAGYLAELSVPTGVKVSSGSTIARQVATEQELTVFLERLKNSRESAERDLVFAYRIMADLALDDYMNMNHISVSIAKPDTPWNKVMLTARDGFCWHNITNKDLREVDIQQMLADKKANTDIELMDVYCQLISKSPTINTIFHINTSSLLAFSCIRENRLLQFNPICARFFNRIMYVDHLDEIYVGNFITFANVIVVRNFGVIITGSSIEQAFDSFFYFEQMAKLQLKLTALRTANSEVEICEMDTEQTEELQKKYQENSYQLAKDHFDARKRSVLEKNEQLLEQTQQS